MPLNSTPENSNHTPSQPPSQNNRDGLKKSLTFVLFCFPWNALLYAHSSIVWTLFNWSWLIAHHTQIRKTQHKCRPRRRKAGSPYRIGSPTINYALITRRKNKKYKAQKRYKTHGAKTLIVSPYQHRVSLASTPNFISLMAQNCGKTNKATKTPTNGYQTTQNVQTGEQQKIVNNCENKLLNN